MPCTNKLWHLDTMRFTLGTSSGLTQGCRFKGVTLGELGEPQGSGGGGSTSKWRGVKNARATKTRGVSAL